MTDAAEDRDRSIRRRVTAQFTGRGEGAAAWRALDRVLPTDAYLNLGYSPWYLPTLVGSSQGRLAARLADGLARRVDEPAGCPLLDVGCGRGGPTRQFTARGFDATGVDLVPHNVALASGTEGADGPAFVVGDAADLPFADGSFGAAAALDSLVYLPDADAALAELARVLRPGAWVGAAMLVARPEPTAEARAALAAFADAWDMAPVAGAPDRRDAFAAAGLTVETVVDVTPNSVGRLGRYSRPFLALADGPTGGLLRALLRRWDVPPDAAVEQVRAAHRALPSLRHEIVYART